MRITDVQSSNREEFRKNSVINYEVLPQESNLRLGIVVYVLFGKIQHDFLPCFDSAFSINVISGVPYLERKQISDTQGVSKEIFTVGKCSVCLHQRLIKRLKGPFTRTTFYCDFLLLMDVNEWINNEC